MTPADLLATLRALGASVGLDGDQIVVRRRKSVPRELLEALKPVKVEITALLRSELPHPNNINVTPRATSGGFVAGARVITTQAALAPLAAAIEHAGTSIALVLVTSGPDPMLHRPVLLGLAFHGGQCVVDLGAISSLDPLRDALNRVKVVGHRLQGTLAFLNHHYRLTPDVAADAEVQSKLLGGGANLDSRDHDLVVLAETWLHRVLPSEPSVSDIAARAPGVVPALGVRVAALLPLAERLKREIQITKLEKAAFLEHAVLPSFAATSLRGVRVDIERLHAVLAERSAVMSGHEETLHVALGGVSLDDNDEVLDALQTYGLPVEKTGKDTLAPFLSDPVAKALVQYRALRPFTREGGPAILANAAQYLDGRVRPTIDPLGATTGRISYRAPNLQGIEKGDVVRACIIPAPDHVFVVADYATIDLRVLADRIKDQALIAAFHKGADLHRETAALISGKSPADVTEEERGLAKEVNFGIVYGMGAATLALRLFVRFGAVVSVDEAQQMLDRYLVAHPSVRDWQARTRFAPDYELRSASGRIRRFTRDDSYAQRLNAPIQGTVADGLKLALIRLSSVLPKFGAHVVLTVHDEIVVEVPREHAAAVAALLHDHMVAGMAFFVKSVRIIVEIDVRTTWAKGSRVTTGLTP